jgi:protein-tyrosine phosphatase
LSTEPARSQLPALPPARRPDPPYRVGIVCLGNICRSPIAEFVLRQELSAAGLGAQVLVDSAGTGDWHVGEPMDPRAGAVLASGGYDGSGHRARQVDPGWLAAHDLLLAMDSSNLAALRRMVPGGHLDRLLMFRAFDPRAGEQERDVPDPYDGRAEDFSDVLAIIRRSCSSLVAALGELLR